jgi:rhodanese-related sulfurtransferase
MTSPATGRRTVDDLVAEARDAIESLTPEQAWEAALAGARVIDIRSDSARARDGIVPGSFHIPRTVLEWRLDVSSPWRNEHFSSLDDALVVICDHGYSSSLAAFALVQLGYRRVADVTGGFEAWRLAGMPVARPPEHVVANALPGSASPDDPEQIHRWERAFREVPERYGAEASAAARATLPALAAANVHELLELGAGQGRDTVYFAAAGLRVTALDFTTGAAETLAAKAAAAGLAEAVTVCRHDVRDPLPFSDGTYDACYSHMLFCMALDEAELIGLAGEIRRTLRPGAGSSVSPSTNQGASACTSSIPSSSLGSPPDTSCSRSTSSRKARSPAGCSGSRCGGCETPNQSVVSSDVPATGSPIRMTSQIRSRSRSSSGCASGSPSTTSRSAILASSTVPTWSRSPTA